MAGADTASNVPRFGRLWPRRPPAAPLCVSPAVTRRAPLHYTRPGGSRPPQSSHFRPYAAVCLMCPGVCQRRRLAAHPTAGLTRTHHRTVRRRAAAADTRIARFSRARFPRVPVVATFKLRLSSGRSHGGAPGATSDPPPGPLSFPQLRDLEKIVKRDN